MKKCRSNTWSLAIMFFLFSGLFLTALATTSGDESPAGRYTEDWVRVVSGGFNDTSNIGINNFVEYNGYLYASVYNKRTGPAVWRTLDGLHWEKVRGDGFGGSEASSMILYVFKSKLFAGIRNGVEGASIWASGDGVKFDQVVSKGLGDKDNIGIGTPIIFRDKLLVPVQNGYVSSIKDGAEIWLSEDGLAFKRIVTRGLDDPSNILLRFLPTLFKDYIYLGTHNPVKGGEIWRSRDGVEWEKMIEDGFGDVGNTILDPQVVFKDKIYVLTYNLNGLSVFRSGDGENWERVVENGFSYGSYRNVYGLLTVIDENLYLTTFSTPGVGAFQLWKTSDGENWVQIRENGFSNDNNYGAGLFMASDGLYYLSTINVVDGCEAWRSKNSEYWEIIFKEERGYKTHVGCGLGEFKNYLYMYIYDNERGIEIWRYNRPLATASTMETTRPTTWQTTPSHTTTQTSITEGSKTLTTETTKRTQTLPTKTVTPTYTQTSASATETRTGWGNTEYIIAASIAAVAGIALYFILKIKLLAKPLPPPPPP